MSSQSNRWGEQRLWAAIAVVGAAGLAGTIARPTMAVTDEQIDAIIEKAKQAILKRQQRHWAIRVYKRDRKEVLKKVAENGRMVEKLQLEEWKEVPSEVHFGEMLDELPDGGVAFRTTRGEVLEVPKKFVAYCEAPGHFHGEQSGIFRGGSTCVATLALLEAGMTCDNPQIRAALRYLEGYPLRSTYTRALRASVYAHLVARVRERRAQSHFRRLLSEDIRWLERAMSDDGWYHYTTPGKHGSGDHSCSQFGVLGMWAGANVGMEISDEYWRIVEQHWLEKQGLKGAWGYVGRPPEVIPKLRPGDAPLKNLPRATMTTAGVNSLYIVLDKLHTRTELQYRWLKGVRPDPRTREAVAGVFNAIGGGLEWLAGHGGATATSSWLGYQKFGLERLGVASGLKYIGDVDWYAANAEQIAKHKWTGDPVKDGLLLIFLVYGRAPIVFNKLQWGQPDQWNYYFRDLHYLCRFLNDEFETIHKWQIVSLDSSLHDLLDAPVLYIAGSGEFNLTKAQLAKLRDYCEAGGTIVGHPNESDRTFSASFKKHLVDLFADRDYKFRALGKDHPIFSTHYGRSKRTRFRKMPPLEGMDDGGRTFVFMFKGDVAGALHQNRSVTYREAFRVMANIRFYAGPSDSELPGRLRPKGLPGKPVDAVGTLKVGRVVHNADWDANPTAWKRMGARLRHDHGVTVQETKNVQLDDADALKGIDLLHLTGHGELTLRPSARAALKAYLAGGGTVLIDACGGDQAFARSAGDLIDELYPDQSALLAVAHPIVQGGPGGTRKLEKLRPTATGSSRLRGRKAPPFSVVKLDDRVALLFAPFDLTASMDGHFIYKMFGYKQDSARRIMTNLLMWRFDQRKKKG